MIKDRFKKNYVALDAIQQALINDIKDQALEMESLIDRVDSDYDVRCAHIAYTKLEEAVMWAVKGCTLVRKDA